MVVGVLDDVMIDREVEDDIEFYKELDFGESPVTSHRDEVSKCYHDNYRKGTSETL